MKRKIAAVLTAIALAFGMSLVSSSPANADVVCTIGANAPTWTDSSHNYIRGRGQIYCTSQIATQRMLVSISYITSDGSVATVTGTSSGWRDGGPASAMYPLSANSDVKYCSGGVSRTFRTQISHSYTTIYGAYSGIHYHTSGWVNLACSGGLA